MWWWWEKGSTIASILNLIQQFYPSNTGPTMTATFPVFPTWFNQQQTSQDDSMCRLDSSDNDDNTDIEMTAEEDEPVDAEEPPAPQHHVNVSATDLPTTNTLLVIIISAKWTKWMAEIMCSFDVCVWVCSYAWSFTRQFTSFSLVLREDKKFTRRWWASRKSCWPVLTCLAPIRNYLYLFFRRESWSTWTESSGLFVTSLLERRHIRGNGSDTLIIYPTHWCVHAPAIARVLDTYRQVLGTLCDIKKDTNMCGDARSWASGLHRQGLEYRIYFFCWSQGKYSRSASLWLFNCRVRSSRLATPSPWSRSWGRSCNSSHPMFSSKNCCRIIVDCERTFQLYVADYYPECVWRVSADWSSREGVSTHQARETARSYASTFHA